MKTENLRDLIEIARENGYRDVADTMDLMLVEDDPLDVLPSDSPVDGDMGVHFRAGVIWGIERVRFEEGVAREPDRRNFVESLKEKDYRRLADAFEYCWANPEEVTDDDFDVTELPITGELLAAFSLGMSFGIAHVRAGNL